MKAPASLVAVLLLLSCPALGQTASSQQTAPAQQTTPAPAPAGSTPSTETAATADAVPAARVAPVFGPGAKLFLEPMGGFEERLAYSIEKKKVPVVLVKDRADADFILSGGAHVHKRGFFTGFVLSTKGKGSISIKDAHTGNEVFAFIFRRVDAMTTVDQDYQNWADSCAGHLKKAMEKK